MYYLILWTGVDELGRNKVMNHGWLGLAWMKYGSWLVGWALVWC